MLYSKKQILIMLLLWSILTLIAYFTIKMKLNVIHPLDMELMYKNGMATEIYFNLLNGNRNFYFIIVLIASIPSIFVIKYYKYYHNKFLYLINERISFKKYTIKMLIEVFLSSFIFYLIINITVLLLVHTTYIRLYFPEKEVNMILFSISPSMNLFLYVVCSCIGFGIYNIFLTQTIIFIKNEFVFRAFSIINFVSTLVLYAVVSGVIAMQISDVLNVDVTNINTYLSVFVPINLYTPGLLFESHGALAFLLSSITYISISIVLWKISYKKVTISG